MRKRRPSPCMQRKLRPERNTTHTPPYSITASTGTEWKRRQASHSKLRHMSVTVSARWRITLSRELPCQTRSEEHTSELQSLMSISYALFCLKTKKQTTHSTTKT